MYCSNCVMHLEALEDEIAGILSIQGSYQKQSLVVEYDETLTDEAQICAVIVYSLRLTALPVRWLSGLLCHDYSKSWGKISCKSLRSTHMKSPSWQRIGGW